MASDITIETSRPVILDGVAYSKGRHDVPPSATRSWFFEALVKEGVIKVFSNNAINVPVESEVKPRKSKRDDNAKPATD